MSAFFPGNLISRVKVRVDDTLVHPQPSVSSRETTTEVFVMSHKRLLPSEGSLLLSKCQELLRAPHSSDAGTFAITLLTDEELGGQRALPQLHRILTSTLEPEFAQL